MTENDSGMDQTERGLRNLYSTLARDAGQAADAEFDPAVGLAQFTAWLNDRSEAGTPDQPTAPTGARGSGPSQDLAPAQQGGNALRLIAMCRRALAGGESQMVMAEVRQALALTQAIGSRLAISGPPELRAQALALSELAGRGCAVVDAPPPDSTGLRATQLHDLGDGRQTLLHLGGLLGEVSMALVGAACEADDESAYWQYMEAIDATDEARDRVVEILRNLAASSDTPLFKVGGDQARRTGA
jgi:hypothetical protein